MILYHGGSQEIREPRLNFSRRSLDFGPGFYMTSDFEQASALARRVARAFAARGRRSSIFTRRTNAGRL